MTILEAVKSLLEKVKAGGWADGAREAYNALTPDQKGEFNRLDTLRYFAPENAQVQYRKEELSPSGKYKLVTTPFSTKAGSWNYTQGLVFEIGNDQPIAEVRRNYSSFPFLFIEDHPLGAFLVCGEDYQGQTVIELDTGKRRDHLSKGTEDGAGFCWSVYEFDRATQMLLVEGCHWACPYEYRFYDFSDPMTGWPEIEAQVGIFPDMKAPEFGADGIIKCFTTYSEADEDSDEPTPVEQREVASILTFKREGLKLVQLDEWVSDLEARRRAAREEARKRYDEKMKAFRSGDPLYLAFTELVKDPELSPEAHEWTGITYDGWCPTFTGRESRIGRRIVTDRRIKDKAPYTFDLGWAMETGPIKVEGYKEGKHFDDRFFPHSVEGMQAAFAYVKEMLRG